ncbi:hypothetical protein D3C85_996680 [compost metagenome]
MADWNARQPGVLAVKLFVEFACRERLSSSGLANDDSGVFRASHRVAQILPVSGLDIVVELRRTREVAVVATDHLREIFPAPAPLARAPNAQPCLVAERAEALDPT